jgi:hypothetical protein
MPRVLLPVIGAKACLAVGRSSNGVTCLKKFPYHTEQNPEERSFPGDLCVYTGKGESVDPAVNYGIFRR